MRRPLCFVLMPFRKGRSDNEDLLVDFDAVYADLITPAIETAGMRAHRADEETLGGIFHKHMFERLTLCEYAVADLSMANPNVFYELGIRHAVRPWSTVLMFRDDAPLPLDVAEAHALKYSMDVLADAAELERLRDQLTSRLVRAQQRETDSPVHMLLSGMPVPEVDHRRVDLMLEAIDQEAETAGRIRRAQQAGLDQLCELREQLRPIQHLDSESCVSLLLAFRSREGWDQMISLVEQMTPELAEVMLVREQYALALARVKRFDEAAGELDDVIRRRPSAETYGLLGGVRKREWQSAVEEGRSPAYCRRLLKRAIDNYRAGFDLDLRDPYPGINALGLSAAAGDAEAVATLAPVVGYSIARRLEGPRVEFWDHACAVELALILNDIDGAERAFPPLLDKVADQFQASTTGSTILSIADRSPDEGFARRARGLAEELALMADEI